MVGGVTRRATLAGVAGLALTRDGAAQGLRGVATSSIQIPTADGSIGVLSPVRPPGNGPVPVVLVLAGENASPEQLVADALDRLTKEGFLAAAPDVFAGDPSDSVVMQRIDATRDWAGKNSGDVARLGIVGFGPGGRAAWLYDAHSPALKAAVAWYGPMQGAPSPARPTTALDAAGHLNAPLLGLYGKNDGTPQRVLLDAEARSKQAGKTADIVLYTGVGPNFAVPGTASFDQAATLDGWQRTIAWLRDHGMS